MQYILAALPILLLVILLAGLRWSMASAGAASFVAAVLIAFFSFGLTSPILLISQLKGILLSLYVMAVIWPALLFFNLINEIKGIDALASGMEALVGNRGLLLVVIAWVFSGMLEGIAGFGIPIAVVAPILVSLGVQPLTAVASVAIGHAWAVTFGSMGIGIQTLAAVLNIDPLIIMPATVLLLSIACFFCGLAAAWMLKQLHTWPFILLISILISPVLYTLSTSQLMPLAAFGSGLAGVFLAILITRKGKTISAASGSNNRLYAVVLSYLLVVTFLLMIFVPSPIRTSFAEIGWKPQFSETITLTGWKTSSSPGQAILPFIHPGTAMFFATILCSMAFLFLKILPKTSISPIIRNTVRSAVPPSLGIIFTVGLSSLMEYTGMTYLLARGLAELFGASFPLVAPLIGMLGSFSTGSNNNSNVLFAPMQRNTAELVGVDFRTVVAQQTSGGSLGSMIAPAKLSVGCATSGIPRQEGSVLRKTLPIGLSLAGLLGLIGLLIIRLV
jgi:lactate permease